MTRHRFRPTLDLLEDRAVPATLPDGFSETILASGLASPTAMSVAPDGRIFVTEQTGALRVVRPDGTLLDQPFLDVTTDPRGERGLLGVTFDPDFADNQFVYVYYTVPGGNGDPPFNRVSRFTASGDTAVPGSELVLLELDFLSGATNHNGGALHFGDDGKLYIAVGENATPSNSQTLDNLLGKVLRINPDGTIPTDNPFFNQTTGDNRAIWALGLRNPFTFAVQPGTGRIFINDVGQGTWEEINEGIAGANYGWPETEGPTDDPRFTAPLFAYRHGPADDEGFAITGGTFYNPTQGQFPGEFTNDYFFADVVNGWIRRLDFPTGQDVNFATELSLPVDLRAEATGGLLYLQRGTGSMTGSLVRINFDSALAPTIRADPQDQIVSVGQDATFTAEAEGAQPLGFQWLRDNAPIPGATGPSFTLTDAQLADNGSTYRLRVVNAFGEALSDPATLTVTTDQAPVPVIDTPTPGTTFVAGQTFDFSGSATDPETGQLPPSALTWRVDYITGGLPRPFVPEQSGITSGSFTIPQRTPFLGTDVSYRIILTATDPVGLQTTIARELLPVTSTVTVASGSGGPVIVDGMARTSPFTFDGVAGVIRDIEAPATINVNGRRMTFRRWDIGGGRMQEFVTPTDDATISASYQQAAPLVIGPGPGLGSTVIVEPVDIDGQTSFDAFPGFAGGVRTASGDVNGDGIPDTVVGTGPGGAPLFRVLDGATGAELFTDMAFEVSFTGGIFVAAADFNGDGFDEIILTPDEGGGPRVRVLDGRNGQTLRDFFGIEDDNFRGGVRAAAGDVNGDGVPDLLVGAGFGGGPRVAVFDGARLFDPAITIFPPPLPAKLVPDFFAFEPGLRNGAFLAGGDVNGDGFAEVIAGAGPGGGPRVFAIDGKTLLDSSAGNLSPAANFFAGDVNNRGGVRVTVKYLDDDNLADVVVGAGQTAAPLVSRYLGRDLTPTGSPSPVEEGLAFDAGFRGGVFVG